MTSKSMSVYAGGKPFVNGKSLLDGMIVYAGGVAIHTERALLETTASGEITITLAGAIGEVTIEWGDGDKTTNTLVPGGTPYVHDYGGAGTRWIQIYGAVKKVTSFDANNCLITEFFNFKNFSSLVTLKLQENNLVNLNGLIGSQMIEHLEVWENNLVDIKGIKNITPIDFLIIRKNYTLVDISPLGNLTNLIHLQIYYSDIEDLSPLINLVNLNALYANDTNVTYTTLNWPTYTSGTFNFSSTVNTSAEVDLYLADHNAALWATLTVYYNGTNPVRTSVSDDDLAGMIVRGCTVYVNE